MEEIPGGKPDSRSAPPPAGKGQETGASPEATHSRGSLVSSPAEPGLRGPGSRRAWVRLVCVTRCAPRGHPAGPLSVIGSLARRPVTASLGAPGLRVFTGPQCEERCPAKGRLAVPGFSDCRFQTAGCLRRLSAGRRGTAVRSGNVYSQFIHCLQESPEPGRCGRSQWGPGLVVDACSAGL